MSRADALNALRGLRAVVVGDLMLDEYIYGRATRISQEAPVMVVRRSGSEAVPGGAANVAKNLIALGASVTVAGAVGNDWAADELRRAMADSGLADAILIADASRPTTRKTRVLADSAHQVLRIDEEATHPLPDDAREALGDALTDRLRTPWDVLIFSDYQKGAVTAALVADIIAQFPGRPVIANAKPGSIGWYRGATLVSLNEPETSAAIGSPVTNLDQAQIASRELGDRYGIGRVLVTLGAQGMAVADCQTPAVSVEVFDTAGAGDTTIATVGLALGAGLGMADAMDLASHTAAAVVRRAGVAVPSPEDLRQIAGYPS